MQVVGAGDPGDGGGGDGEVRPVSGGGRQETELQTTEHLHQLYLGGQNC